MGNMGLLSTRLRRTALASCLVIGITTTADTTDAAPSAAAPDITTVVLNGPVGSEFFGAYALVLSNGNYVVTDSRFDDVNVDIGAVYLYDGSNDTVIRKFTGFLPNDRVGSGGVFEVGDSN